MEMPITKPSMVSYADELDFPKLLEDLTRESKNGFIRVTSGAEEGYILLKAGKQVAASYEEYSKLEALEKITSALETPNTVIEIFDIGPAQVDYLLDLNKPYKIEEGANVYDVIGELKKTSTETPVESESEVSEPEVEESESEVSEPEVEVSEPEVEVSEPEVEESEPEVEEFESEVSEPEVEESEVVKSEVEEPEILESDAETETPTNKAENVLAEEKIIDESVVDESEVVEKLKTAKESGKQSEYLEASLKAEETDVEKDSESSEPVEAEEIEEVPADRSELLKKYGIKEVEDEQVEDLLQTYKGGIIDDDDVEKVELVLMNLIKKSVLGIPKIKGTEVMVFLDNYKELTGTINIITEFETQGFFNRIMGQSRTANNLRRQIINIAEIAIRKSFRQYPEVVDKFEINVEFS